MAVTFTDNWGNILTKLTNIFRQEFDIIVVKGAVDHSANSFIRLIPESSSLEEMASFSKQMEYSITVQYVTASKVLDEQFMDYITRQSSRVEALIFNNQTMALSDDTTAFNCRLESQEFDIEAEGLEDKYIIGWDYNCSHVAV